MGYGFHYFKGENLSRVTRVTNAILSKALSLNWDDSKIDVSKNWIITHLMTVGQIAHILALKRGVDPEIAKVTAVLHDIAVVEGGGMEKGHAVNGYEPAKKLLREVGGFTEAEIEEIATAIKKHSEKNQTGTALEEIIKDADVLDCSLHGADFSQFEFHYKRFNNVKRELGIS